MLWLRVVILASMLVLTCGQILAWRRRDNIFGYIQAATFVATITIPLLGTSLLRIYEDQVLEEYAELLSLGAVAYVIGIAIGVRIGHRSVDRLPLTFTEPLERNRLDLITRRARAVASAAAVALGASFALLGYVPLLADDRLSAKYGVGAYGPGFERGRLVYMFALALASAVLPVTIILFYRCRRLVDLALAVVLEAGLVATLNRGLAFAGLVVALVAIAVERRVTPLLTAFGVALVFLSAILFNRFTLPEAGEPPRSFGAQALASSPDLADHLNYLRGYGAAGRPQNRGRTIISGLLPGGNNEAATHALKMATGLPDVTQLAAGGVRLPAPLWGYSDFGWWGALWWSLISGLFAGWGATKFKRQLTGALDAPGQSVNLVLAVVVYNGTFKLLEQFYFTATAGFVLLGVALALGVWAPRSAERRRALTGAVKHSGQNTAGRAERPFDAGSV